MRGSTLLTEYTAFDAFGNLTGETYGSGWKTAKTYDTNTGKLKTIQTGTASLPTSVQDLVYNWHTDGTLHERIDMRGTSSESDDLKETFSYDDLPGRLTGAGTQPMSRDLGFTYDVHGNLKSKTSDIAGDLDVTNYNYTTPSKPHRLENVVLGGTFVDLSYDAAGRVTTYDHASGDDTFLGYDNAGRVEGIVVGQSYIDSSPASRDEFWYGPDGERFLRKASWGGTSNPKVSWTLYLYGGAFEEVQPIHDPLRDYRQRVRVSEHVSHRRNKVPAGAWNSVDYFHRDHLGSITKVSDSGIVVHQAQFDPFGRQRETDWSSDITPANLGVLASWEDANTGRGFTDHVMLNRSGFIHMNGRVYDSRLGRFVQPDPFVSHPTLSDSYNRYAYALNSPLSVTDPTGLFNVFHENGAGDGGGSVSVTVAFGTSAFGDGYTSSLFANRFGGVGGGGVPAGGPGGGAQNDILDILSNAWGTYACVRYGLCGGGAGMYGGGGFGTGACPSYICMNIVEQGGMAHEAFQILWPGYDLGNCMSAWGDCSTLDWLLAGVGAIPGGKLASVGGAGILGIVLSKGRKVPNGAAGRLSGQGFDSFYALKRHLGPAGEGRAWHHIVEQTPGNVGRFGPQSIHNTANVVSVPHGKGLLHQQISGFYSSKQPFTGGQTVREWLSTKSFEEQYEFGQRILRQFGGP